MIKMAVVAFTLAAGWMAVVLALVVGMGYAEYDDNIT